MYPAKPSDGASSSAAQVTGIPIVGGVSAAAGTGQWSSALCDCMSDLGVCCMTCWFPCITFGRVAEIVDHGGTSCGATGTIYALLCCCMGCHRIYSCTYRSKMRTQYGLPERPCCDCCVHFCCEPCALCQHYRELKARGFEPELGWALNAQRQSQRGAGTGATMYPPAAQAMGR